jgi:CheY-like chemotaxis protein
MTGEVQAQLFEAFFTTKPQGVGAGLGLATVHGIVKQAVGWIWVYSEVGRGSAVKIYLPRVDKPVTQIQTAPKTDIPGAETILVVEDYAEVGKLTVLALRKLGYKAPIARRPDEALALAQSFPKPIHLLLTDVVMPGMTGREMGTEWQSFLPACRFSSCRAIPTMPSSSTVYSNRGLHTWPSLLPENHWDERSARPLAQEAPPVPRAASVNSATAPARNFSQGRAFSLHSDFGGDQ